MTIEKDCKECGEEIGEGRLKAKPNAELCIECQTKLEREGRFRLHRMDTVAVLKAGEIDSLESRFYRGTET